MFTCFLSCGSGGNIDVFQEISVEELLKAEVKPCGVELPDSSGAVKKKRKVYPPFPLRHYSHCYTIVIIRRTVQKERKEVKKKDRKVSGG